MSPLDAVLGLAGVIGLPLAGAVALIVHLIRAAR